MPQILNKKKKKQEESKSIVSQMMCNLALNRNIKNAGFTITIHFIIMPILHILLRRTGLSSNWLDHKKKKAYFRKKKNPQRISWCLITWLLNIKWVTAAYMNRLQWRSTRKLYITSRFAICVCPFWFICLRERSRRAKLIFSYFLSFYFFFPTPKHLHRRRKKKKSLRRWFGLKHNKEMKLHKFSSCTFSPFRSSSNQWF